MQIENQIWENTRFVSQDSFYRVYENSFNQHLEWLDRAKVSSATLDSYHIINWNNQFIQFLVTPQNKHLQYGYIFSVY